MNRIFKIEGGLIPEYLSENIKIFMLHGYYDDGSDNCGYINYDNHYISLVRQDYGDAEIEFYPQAFRPAQFAGEIQFGYNEIISIAETLHRDDIQISGYSIYENIQHNNNCIANGRAINNINERSDLYTFYLPHFTISGATKIVSGTTTASTGVYIVDSLGTGLTFTSIFDSVYNTPFFIDSFNGIKFKLYYRTSPTTIVIGSSTNPYELVSSVDNPIFNSNPINSTNYFTKENLYNFGLYSAVTYTLDLNSLEGEFLIKGFWRWTNFTYFSNLLDAEYYEENEPIVGDRYNIYESNIDYYFIYLQRADKPIVASSQMSANKIDLSIYSIRPSFNGQSEFPLPNTPISKPIITINGVTLSTFEYVLTGQTISIIGGSILMSDIINIIYSTSPGSQAIQSESYQISTIPNVESYTSVSKVIYNSGTTKYEYWLDVKSVGDVIITVNGQTLSKNIDYYVSSSDSRRIIFTTTLVIGDVINAYYNSIIGDNKINFPSYQISWKIPPPKNNMGFFTIEVTNYGDTQFTNPVYTGVTIYEANNDNYFGEVIFSGNYGDRYIYRIKNQKNYYTVLGELIYTINYSDTIPLTINTNALNNY